MGPIIVDTNLILILIVGLTDSRIITTHRNLSAYTPQDYVSLAAFLAVFSDIILLPHILTEVSNLARQIRNPYKAQIQRKLMEFIELNGELVLPSTVAVRRAEFMSLGLTDAAILSALNLLKPASGCALFTTDGDLAVAGEMLGHDVYTIEALRG